MLTASVTPPAFHMSHESQTFNVVSPELDNDPVSQPLLQGNTVAKAQLIDESDGGWIAHTKVEMI